MPRAEMDHRQWLVSSRLKLEASGLFYGKKDYGNAISSLHGSEERTAKAILLRLSFLPDDPGFAGFLKKIIGVKYTTPKALNHDWHVQFLKDLNPYIDILERIGTSFGNKKPGWRTTQYWRTKGPEFRKKVEVARSIQSKPTPSKKELIDVLDGCNRLLDEIEESAPNMKSAKIKIPKARQVDPAAKIALKSIPVYVPREIRKDIEEAFLESFRSGASRFASNVSEITVLVQLLLVLAVLNVYLNRHHVLGEYPTSEVKYTKSFSMVRSFTTIQALLNRGVEMAVRHSGAILVDEGIDGIAEVRDSSIQGWGVFVARDFAAAETIFDIDDSDVISDVSKLTRHDLEFEADYLQGGKIVRLRSPFKYVNHSCDPNAYVKTIKGVRKALAMRDVKKGEELTYDYSINGFNGGTFECRCGSENCRKTYHGNFFKLPRDIQTRYLPYLDDWFKDEHVDEVKALKSSQ